MFSARTTLRRSARAFVTGGCSQLSLAAVVPTHETRELTLRCLAALLAAAPDAEVVLVDDASGDGTAAAVAAVHPGVRVLRLAAPAGFTRAANIGLAATTHDIVLLLNSDTEVDASGIAALRRRFAADPRLGAAGAALHFADGSPQWSGGREPTLAWLLALASGAPALLARLPLYRRLKPPGARSGDHVEWVTGAALAVRRAAWQEVGPFDEGFRFYGQDLDLCCRLRAAGWDVALLRDFRVLHHQGATIRRRAGAAGGRQHTELLWGDLVRWAEKRHGAAWARRAARALTAGGRLRLAARSLASPFLSPRRRGAWREQSGSLRQALAALQARGVAAADLPGGPAAV